MNARLQPIGIRPLVRPRYDNEHLGHESDWIAANVGALRAWWSSCEETLGTPLEQDDFSIFCRAQHDAELQRREDFKNYLRQR
jgi:hypothetical protein